MKSKLKILITSMDYADEFDVAIVSVFTNKEHKAIKKASKNKRDKDFEIGFGTNESLEATIGEFVDMLDSAEPVSKKELKLLRKFGVTDMCGTVDIVDRLKDRLKIKDKKSESSEDSIPY